MWSYIFISMSFNLITIIGLHMANCRGVTDQILGKVAVGAMLKDPWGHIWCAGPNFEPETAYYNYKKAPNPEAHWFYDMLKSIDTSLYEGCTKYSQFSTIVRLLYIKSENNMSEKCFDQILQLLKDVLPEGNKVVDDWYQTKKLVSCLNMQV